MSTFDQELQNLLDQHPEIIEVKVKYRKPTAFKPRISASLSAKKAPYGLAQDKAGVPVASGIEAAALAEIAIASDMLKKGELS